MDQDIHSDPLTYRTVVASEGFRLSEETVQFLQYILKESSL